MKQYKYVISGEYNDWFEFRKENILIHKGTLLGILKKTENDILLRVNYNTEKYFNSKIKYIDDLKVVVPKEPDLLQKDYKYQTIIFNTAEFKEFIDNIYFDEKLIKNLSKVNKKDLLNMWFFSIPNHKNYINLDEMKKDILSNILFFSDDNFDINQLSNMINTSEFSINPIPDNHESVSIYVDSDKEEMYEWNGLVKINNRIFLKLDDRYYLNY
ncbi:hypothetical protein JZO79_12005 [Vagococcus fluvialis]|uniref:hypothetical protein n=1 Tax=Vagococcus fluvialis TaxID=2738 RepID=UPI001A8CDAAB|nr:hypothetical protein [Vagococcus fluvialis]MBO0444338.1 hypothetical protein [Vagococcus fluvialis]